MKYIGPKISCQEKGRDFSIVIDARGERYEQALLWIWVSIWFGVGVYFASYLFIDADYVTREFELFVFVFMAFWAFYFIKAFGMALWRSKGYESLFFTEDKLILTRYNGLRFKRDTFFNRNIEDFEKLDVKTKSVMNAYYSGFWVKGLDLLSFKYQGKKVSFAKQLDRDAADALYKLVRKLIKGYK